LIESRFGMPLTLEELAEHAGVSRYHLSRIFPLETGYSIKDYLRGRRLTEAAKALAGGAPDILGVALDAGYGSLEAFTRAFRDVMGVTPEELRRRRSLDAVPMLHPMRIDPRTRVTLGAPVIENRPALRLAGLVGRHMLPLGPSIPAQWQRFGPYVGNVHGAIGEATYGTCGSYFPEDGTTEYLCGIEVSEGAELPPEFTEVVVPAQRYARLTHRGHVTTIFSTIEAIFCEWLPSSGFRKKHAPYTFIEHYDEAFNPRTGLGSLDIWIALED
jgi:AraC family transcriptional regulator